MTIVSAGTPGVAAAASTSASPAAGAARTGAAASATPFDDAVKEFLNYMKETPAQRMEDKWLKAHHLTRQQLASMPPEERHALEQQMASDIKNAMKQKNAAQQTARIAAEI